MEKLLRKKKRIFPILCALIIVTMFTELAWIPKEVFAQEYYKEEVTASTETLDNTDESQSASINLGKYITDVNFNKEQILEGENVKLDIGYEIGSDILKNAGTNLITYTLPEGITANEIFEGEVYNKLTKKVVGTYVIKEDTMKITLNQDFIDSGETIHGSIGFFVQLDSSKDTEDTVHKYEFPESGKTVEIIIIKKDDTSEERADIQVKKSGKCEVSETGDYTFHYTIDVTTENGTKEEISTFTDYLTTEVSATKCDVSKMTLIKYDSDGQKAQMNASEYFQCDADGRLTLVKSLPVLNGGEKYQLSYSVTVLADAFKNLNYDISVCNKVLVGNSLVKDESENTQYIYHTWISKSGYYNSTDKKVVWTITLNQFGGNLSGYQLTDRLTNNGVEVSPAPSEITIQEVKADKSTVDLGSAKLPITFNDNTITDADGKIIQIQDVTHKFVITYETVVIDEGYSINYENKATISDGGDSHEAEASVQGIIENVLEKEKTQVGNDMQFTNFYNQETYLGQVLEWKSTIHITSDGIKDGAVYEDWVDTISYWDEEAEQHAYYHFFTYDLLASLKNGIPVYKTDQETSSKTLQYGTDYSIEVTYINDKYGGESTISLEEFSKLTSYEQLPIRKYKIVFKSSVDSTYDHVELVYSSFRRTDDMSNGQTRTFKNDACFTQDGMKSEDSAEDTYHMEAEELIKDDNGFSPDGSYVYEEIDGILKYRLKVNINENMSGEIKITDVLPRGTELYKEKYIVDNEEGYTIKNKEAEDSTTQLNQCQNASTVLFLLAAYDYEKDLYNRYYSSADNKDNATAYEHGADYSYEESTRTLTITIPEAVYHNQQNKSSAIYVYYAVKITDQAADKAVGKYYETYTNKATLINEGIAKATDSVTISVSKSNLIKESVDRDEEDNKVTYSIKVNQEGKDLRPDSDTLELIDTVDLSSYKEYVKDITLVPGSFHLYEMNKDGSKGSEVSSSNYQVTKAEFSASTGKFEMNLIVKDGQAYILEYTYSYSLDDVKLYDDGRTTIPITNKIKIVGGETSDSSQVENEYKVSGSYAWADTCRMELWKLDLEDQTHALKGAIFTVKKWENGSWKDVKTGDSIKYYTTGEDGKVVLDIVPNVAYCITEVSAPTGYLITEGSYYIYRLGDTSEYPQSMPENYIEDYNAQEVTEDYFTVTNKKDITQEKTSIAVKKVWKDASGNEIAGDSETLPETIKITLYQTTDKDDTKNGTKIGESITISPDAGGNWYYSFNDLRKKADNGDTYYYYVVEEKVDGYKESYDTSIPIDEGTIVITNKKNPTLTVEKKWQTVDGSHLDAVQDSISFAVFTSKDKLDEAKIYEAKQTKDDQWVLTDEDGIEQVGVDFDGVYEVGEKDGWKWTQSYDLPQETYFYVVELTQGYLVSYISDKGNKVQYAQGDGGVTIINTVQSIELPVTGAKIPIGVFLLVGMCYVMAVYGEIKLKKIKKKGKDNMKNMKKRLSAIILAFTMVLSMVASVSAASNGGTSTTNTYKLELTDSSDSQNGQTTYNIFKIFDGKITGDLITYTFTDVNKELASAALKDAGINNTNEIDSSNVEAFLEELMKYVDLNYTAGGKWLQPIMENGSAKEFTKGTYDLEAGYYLVVATGKASVDNSDGKDCGGTVTSPILVAVPQTANSTTPTKPTIKSSKTTIEKKIVEKDESGNRITVDTSDATKTDTTTNTVGDTIKYQLTATVPAYGEDVDQSKVTFWITDTPSEGITLKPETFKASIGAYALTESNDYTVVDNKDGSYTLKFKYEKLASYANQTVNVEVEAILNEKALVSDNQTILKNDNKVTLKYTNNYYTGETEDIDDIVTTYSYKFGIKKVDEDSNEVLQGAEFALYKGNVTNVADLTTETPIRVGATDDKGLLSFEGLDAGEYTLVETKAPDGYTIMQERVLVTIKAEKGQDGELTGYYTVNGSSDNTVTITNKKGLNLPGTGGMGTTIFMVAGVVCIVLAGGLFVMNVCRQRKERD